MNVIFMVSDRYPHKFTANNIKAELVAMGLQEAGCKVAMLDGLWGSKGYSKPEYGTSEKGIDYCILPRIGKYSAFIHNIPIIWRYLKERRDEDGNHLCMSLTIYPFFFIIWGMAVLLGYKRSNLFHEWDPSCFKKYSLMWFEAEVRGYTFGWFLNYIFPISHVLGKKCAFFRRRTFTIPVLASYDRNVKLCGQKVSFTFCGNAGYLVRNSLVLDAFKNIVSKNQDVKLNLVLFGLESSMSAVKTIVKTMGIEESVCIFTQIPQQELYDIYDSSIGLLIPLNPDNMQDHARFSQKIAEYVASKRPIITSNVGEIPYYFENGKNALVVDYNAESYSNAMLKLIDDSRFADELGEAGYMVGIQYFDYKKCGRELANFIKK